MLFGINTTDNGRLVIFGGGVPIIENGQVVGGISVSGGSVEQDVNNSSLFLLSYAF